MNVMNFENLVIETFSSLKFKKKCKKKTKRYISIAKIVFFNLRFNSRFLCTLEVERGMK